MSHVLEFAAYLCDRDGRRVIAEVNRIMSILDLGFAVDWILDLTEPGFEGVA